MRRIDDPIGTVPVHMLGGIWGTLSLGLFASGAYGLPTPNGVDVSTVITGLFYGGGFTQLSTQFIGSFAVTAVTLVASFILMYALNAVGLLRVSKEGELEGLDIHEHGASAYPALSGSKSGSPISLDIHEHGASAYPEYSLALEGHAASAAKAPAASPGFSPSAPVGQRSWRIMR